MVNYLNIRGRAIEGFWYLMDFEKLLMTTKMAVMEEGKSVTILGLGSVIHGRTFLDHN